MRDDDDGAVHPVSCRQAGRLPLDGRMDGWLLVLSLQQLVIVINTKAAGIVKVALPQVGVSRV